MSNFIVLEVLIGYFKKIILAKFYKLKSTLAAYVSVLMYGNGDAAKWKHRLKYFGFSHLSSREDAVKL